MNRQRQQYGLERLGQVIVDHHAAPMGHVCQAILASVRAWMSEQLDDISIVAIRQKGA